MGEPVREWEGVVKSAMWAIERNGFCVTWIPPGEGLSRHIFRSVDPSGEIVSVEGSEPVEAIAELMARLGFEDLD